jgi:CopG family nickel-responsive transcriptional regulator
VQHFHLSHELCLEIIAVKGQANDLTRLADKLIALKGIRHGKLVMTQSNELDNGVHHHFHQ